MRRLWSNEDGERVLEVWWKLVVIARDDDLGWRQLERLIEQYFDTLPYAARARTRQAIHRSQRSRTTT